MIYARQSGFTLLELVVVIAIIAVLAAIALPRLIEIQRDARITKAKAFYGSIRSAAALARARCELDLAAPLASLPATNCQALPPRIDMDGKTIEIVGRYPAATAAGIDAAADLDLIANGLTASNCTPDARCFDVAGGTVPDCRITYQATASSSTAIIAPVITVVTTGC